MIDRDTLLGLVPHQGAMCLWDRVLDWDDTRIRLATATHRDPAHPLRGAQGLRAVHLCEYGAQAMAVHGGLRGHEAGLPVRPGMLVALRGIRLHVPYIDAFDGELVGEAEAVAESADSQQYAFRILHGDRLLAEGRAAVMLG
ncbi:phosphotransferase [Lysobacteraceae bacterium NML91-0213]|nr:phosphotransferase [Xanthomonadaceae bacterium NML91-0213]